VTQEIQSAPLNFSILVGSPIYHDLIRSLGAIANGVEMMALTCAEQTPASNFSDWHTALQARINLCVKAS
jgi:hypothetical protein